MKMKKMSNMDAKVVNTLINEVKWDLKTRYYHLT